MKPNNQPNKRFWTGFIAIMAICVLVPCTASAQLISNQEVIKWMASVMIKTELAKYENRIKMYTDLVKLDDLDYTPDESCLNALDKLQAELYSGAQEGQWFVEDLLNLKQQFINQNDPESIAKSREVEKMLEFFSGIPLVDLTFIGALITSNITHQAGRVVKRRIDLLEKTLKLKITAPGMNSDLIKIEQMLRDLRTQAESAKYGLNPMRRGKIRYLERVRVKMNGGWISNIAEEMARQRKLFRGITKVELAALAITGGAAIGGGGFMGLKATTLGVRGAFLMNIVKVLGGDLLSSGTEDRLLPIPGTTPPYITLANNIEEFFLFLIDAGRERGQEFNNEEICIMVADMGDDKIIPHSIVRLTNNIRGKNIEQASYYREELQKLSH